MPNKGKRAATGGKQAKSKQVSPKGRSRGSKAASPKQKGNCTWYNVNSLAALALLLANTRTTFLNFLKSKTTSESDDGKTLKQANEWADLSYNDAKYAVVKNIDKLAENDRQIKSLVSESVTNMNVSQDFERSLHSRIVTTLFGDDCEDSSQQKNVDNAQTPKSDAFLKSPTKNVPKSSCRSAKRKLDDSQPRPIRGKESEESPKRQKMKIVQDGEDAMPETIYEESPPATPKSHGSKISTQPALDSLEKMILSQKENVSINTSNKFANNGSSPPCTLPSSPITPKPASPARNLSPLNLTTDSILNTPSPKHSSFDSSLEGLLQVTESNKKIVEQEKAKLANAKNKRSIGIKIHDPTSPSHASNTHNESDDESPKNRILPPTAWSRDPHLATDAGMAWKMGGLFGNSSQTPGSSSNLNSTPIPEPMEATPGTSKRKTSDSSPSLDQNVTKKQRKSSPVKSETSQKDSQSQTKSTAQNPSSSQKEKKNHAIPAFFFPRNVKNYRDFCTELADKNPEIRNGFDLGTFKNGQKYIKPRTLQIANRFKSPLSAFGMLYDFTQVNSDQTSGHSVKIIKVPYSRNTCKSFDSNSDINWIKVSDIRNAPNGMRTCTLIMNFKNVAPPKVYVGSLAFSTHAYKPEPKRCTKCQHFGHYKNQCKRATNCTFCAEPHDSSVCYQKKQNGEPINLKCSNCGGPHAASSKKCPVYLASVRSIQNEPSSQPTTSAPVPEKRQASSQNTIPNLLDIEVFPPLTRRIDCHLHISYDKGFEHPYKGNMATTLHLLRQMKKVHPTAKLAIENLAFSIGGESFRNVVKK